MPVEPGRNLLHYRIVDKLGEGGMGDVYRAEDSRLGREIAIKVLPAKLADDPQRRHRFAQEARAVAALKHPNIVTIYSIEQAEGVHFITMELIEGQPLSALIPTGGLDLARLFQLAIPAAEALSSAHARGVTHRDLKPANIMVDADGRLKVLDFGLAKLLASDPGDATATRLPVSAPRTEQGQILGTAAYMSPEQAEGKPVDARTDIFSFGIVLYEMATGRRPFQGDTAISTISSILRDSPPRVTDLKPGLPRHLGRIIDRCLEKDRGNRFQTARDIFNELQNLKKEIDSGQLETGDPSFAGRTVSTTGPVESPSVTAVPVPRTWGLKLLLAVAAIVVVAAFAARFWLQRPEEAPAPGNATAIPTVAVMGFENLSDSDDKDRLGRVLMGLVTTDLVESRGLDVISTARVLAAIREAGGTAERGFDLAVAVEAAELAGAEVMLVGQVNRDGEKVLLAAELVEVGSGRTTGSIRQEASSFSELFALADSIAAEVRRQLGVGEPGRGKGSFDLAQSLTGSADAYRQYAAGEVAFHLAHFDDALQRFRAAIDLDPQFALAYYRLAMAQSWAGQPALDTLTSGLPFIDRLPDHWQTLYRAYIDFEAGRWIEAREALTPLAQADVPIPDLYYMLSEVATHSSRFWDPRLVRNYSERTLELDPTFSTVWFHLTQTYQLADDRASLQGAYERVKSLGSREERLAVQLTLQVAERRFAQAEQTFADLGLGRGQAYWLMVEPLLQLGKAEILMGTLESLLDAKGVDPNSVHHALGLVHAWQGRFERAIAELTAAATLKAPNRQRSNQMLAVARLRRLTGDLEGARQGTLDAIEVDPDMASCRYWEGKVLIDVGAIAEAENTLVAMRALAARAESPLGGFWTDMLTAELQLARDDVAGARETLGRIVSRPVEYRERLVETRLRARLFEADGDHTGAIEAYGEILDPPWLLVGEQATPWLGWPLHAIEVLYPLARLEQAAGNVDRAREHYRSYVEHWGGADREVRGMADAREQLRHLR